MMSAIATQQAVVQQLIGCCNCRGDYYRIVC